MQTTLNQIKAYHPCSNGYRKLLKFLNKTEADDEPLDLATILESNGIIDTAWCFRAVSGFDKEKRLFAVFCARQVQHLLNDPISINCIDVAERYANGNATNKELVIARHDAYYATDYYQYTAYTACDSANVAAYFTAYYTPYYYDLDTDPDSVTEQRIYEYLIRLFKECSYDIW